MLVSTNGLTGTAHGFNLRPGRPLVRWNKWGAIFIFISISISSSLKCLEHICVCFVTWRSARFNAWIHVFFLSASFGKEKKVTSVGPLSVLFVQPNAAQHGIFTALITCLKLRWLRWPFALPCKFNMALPQVGRRWRHGPLICIIMNFALAFSADLCGIILGCLLIREVNYSKIQLRKWIKWPQYPFNVHYRTIYFYSPLCTRYFSHQLNSNTHGMFIIQNFPLLT